MSKNRVAPTFAESMKQALSRDTLVAMFEKLYPPERRAMAAYQASEPEFRDCVFHEAMRSFVLSVSDNMKRHGKAIATTAAYVPDFAVEKTTEILCDAIAAWDHSTQLAARCYGQTVPPLDHRLVTLPMEGSGWTIVVAIAGTPEAFKEANL